MITTPFAKIDPKATVPAYWIILKILIWPAATLIII